MLLYYIKKLFNFKCFCIQKDTRFYYLSLMKNDNNSVGYNIHGLWPQYNDSNYPKYCKNVDFDIKLLEPLMEDLINYWKPRNTRYHKLEYFWKHEWKKHGSCIFTEINQYEYFKISLDLFKKIMKKNINFDKYTQGNHILIPLTLDFQLNL